MRTRPGFDKAAQNKMLLSAPTRLGLRITGEFILTNAHLYHVDIFAVNSFVELLEFIFTTIPGVTVFLSNRLCQDPLENFFGRQRQRGRVNENPNTAEFAKNTQALRIVNSTCSTVRGNCRGAKEQTNTVEVDNAPLNKRRKKH